MAVVLKPDKIIHKMVVDMPQVGEATYRVALPVYARAVSNLQAVRSKGSADADSGWGGDGRKHRYSIELSRGDVCDAFVELVGPNALALEFGRTAGTKHPMGPSEPTYIMTRAVAG